MDENALSNQIIGAALEVHRQLGPGLLESAYEECLAYELSLRNIPFERQKPVPVIYKGIRKNLCVLCVLCGLNLNREEREGRKEKPKEPLRSLRPLR